MGRQTFESIGKPLPGRENIVVSTSATFPWVRMFNDPELAYDTLADELAEHDELYIIGWATLYSYFIDRAERLYLTEIKAVYQWDTFFPDFEEHFEEVERISHDTYDFVTYRKKRVE
jgi:dihydrofolate reductase